jgi:hypothetical protein
MPFNNDLVSLYLISWILFQVMINPNLLIALIIGNKYFYQHFRATRITIGKHKTGNCHRSFILLV